MGWYLFGRLLADREIFSGDFGAGESSFRYRQAACVPGKGWAGMDESYGGQNLAGVP